LFFVKYYDHTSRLLSWQKFENSYQSGHLIKTKITSTGGNLTQTFERIVKFVYTNDRINTVFDGYNNKAYCFEYNDLVNSVSRISVLTIKPLTLITYYDINYYSSKDSIKIQKENLFDEPYYNFFSVFSYSKNGNLKTESYHQNFECFLRLEYNYDDLGRLISEKITQDTEYSHLLIFSNNLLIPKPQISCFNYAWHINGIFDFYNYSN